MGSRKTYRDALVELVLAVERARGKKDDELANLPEQIAALEESIFKKAGEDMAKYEETMKKRMAKLRDELEKLKRGSPVPTPSTSPTPPTAASAPPPTSQPSPPPSSQPSVPAKQSQQKQPSQRPPATKATGSAPAPAPAPAPSVPQQQPPISTQPPTQIPVVGAPPPSRFGTASDILKSTNRSPVPTFTEIVDSTLAHPKLSAELENARQSGRPFAMLETTFLLNERGDASPELAEWFSKRVRGMREVCKRLVADPLSSPIRAPEVPAQSSRAPSAAVVDPAQVKRARMDG